MSSIARKRNKQKWVPQDDVDDDREEKDVWPRNTGGRRGGDRCCKEKDHDSDEELDDDDEVDEDEEHEAERKAQAGQKKRAQQKQEKAGIKWMPIFFLLVSTTLKANIIYRPPGFCKHELLLLLLVWMSSSSSSTTYYLYYYTTDIAYYLLVLLLASSMLVL